MDEKILLSRAEIRALLRFWQELAKRLRDREGIRRYAEAEIKFLTGMLGPADEGDEA